MQRHGPLYGGLSRLRLSPTCSRRQRAISAHAPSICIKLSRDWSNDEESATIGYGYFSLWWRSAFLHRTSSKSGVCNDERQDLLEFLTTASSCCCMAGTYHDICIDHLPLMSCDRGRRLRAV